MKIRLNTTVSSDNYMLGSKVVDIDFVDEKSNYQQAYRISKENAEELIKELNWVINMMEREEEKCSL